jgi:serine/threonine-protein kinase
MSRDETSVVQAGDILAGKYRVERVLGKGAMGVVVAARHVELGELRAIKFMLPTMFDDVESVERFLREARAVCKLKSQHVVKVYDVGRLDNGAPYIVMEYLEGTDFKTLLQRRKMLPVNEAARYMLQILEAVGEAHSIGIIHRDLKPANLFLTTGVGGAPCVKVLDFGIAKIGSETGVLGEVQMTSTNVVMGTPLFMSPEQMMSTRDVDARSDIWSLGIILYCLVSRGFPFEAETTQAIIASVLRDQPRQPTQWNPELPLEMETIILRCLEKDLARRFQCADELASSLAAFLSQAPPLSRPSYHGPDATEQLSTQVYRPSVAGITASSSQPSSSAGAPSAARQTTTESNGGAQSDASWSQQRMANPGGRGLFLASAAVAVVVVLGILLFVQSGGSSAPAEQGRLAAELSPPSAPQGVPPLPEPVITPSPTAIAAPPPEAMGSRAITPEPAAVASTRVEVPAAKEGNGKAMPMGTSAPVIAKPVASAPPKPPAPQPSPPSGAETSSNPFDTVGRK